MDSSSPPQLILPLGTLRKEAASANTKGEKAEADRLRKTMRVQAIEREHRPRLDDLHRNYAPHFTVEWVQAPELYVPVQRLDVLIRRRKANA